MKIRSGAIAALLIAAAVMAVATAGVAGVSDAVRLAAPKDDGPSQPLRKLLGSSAAPRGRPTLRGEVLAGTAPAPDPTVPGAPTTLVGVASNYPGTDGWIGQATVALPGELGGRYTGAVSAFVTVCADRCARLPVVDWCECHWDTDDRRVVDLSHPAWSLVSDRPLEAGLVEVRLILER